MNSKNGWIFSPRQDFAHFWAPMLAVFLLTPRADSPRFQFLNLAFLIFVLVPFNDGHLFLSAGPALRRALGGKAGALELLAGPAAVLAASWLLYARATPLFFTVLSLVAIHHIMSQQHGWLMLSRRKAGEPPEERLIDVVALWNIMLVPVVWWFSAASPLEKRYYFVHGIAFTVPAAVAAGALWAHWAINAVYLGHVGRQALRGAALNWGKLLLMASTWIWFYGSLIAFPNRLVFLHALVVMHGIPYMRYAREDAAAGVRGAPSRALAWFGNPYAVLLLCAAGGALTRDVLPMTRVFLRPTPLLEIAFLSPAILHYYFDAFLWRTSYWLPPARAA